ncbi:MAG: DNA polymerase III subunit alpha [Bdellovibrionales bacterium CG12_big_fil_rev_8_21_14_0_65_38_15]|nr:MAG: DNA polymerase III subunit alpha [Bdellovibrionales bacterium CG22_combo_CG10-13_8_21_14_all_38_13]PIQ57096.1 MAG: DNA polymerase III subunit alpha [Bdellovibrionales bacterium CG12_big_fil_rev_8_21_14_0_65_38_15]PIR30126.1 MAG: DNA polymerase III subunit alpha [Bdellovibrionales bacterium CG11_big_fil_rev_8_21_14_0_20_38_13]
MTILESQPDSFVHLHLHTQYSLLDGAIRLPDLINQAKEWNIPAIAQTDHGNMFGAIDFYTRCKNAGIKPILGSEIYFTPGSRFDRSPSKKTKSVSNQDAEESSRQIHHLILLCKNNTGYENLCKLLSQAYLEGFYYKPRADLDLLKEFSEGLICTTACLKGEVGYNFFTDQDDKAKKAITKLHDIFGDDFYLEIQQNGLEEQKIVNEKVVAYAKEHGMQVVATNDAHYMTKEDATAQEVLLCVQTGKTYADENRMRMTSQEFYYKSPEEMRRAFADYPEACDNTLRIADKCNVELKWTDDNGNQIYHLPDYPIETDETVDDYFTRMSREGLEKRFAGPHFRKLVEQENWESELKPKYWQRLEDEVKMILQMGFPGYFLIVSDFIKWSKDNGIPVGPGRGSGAGSLVAYSLDITNVDPLPFNLLFERFINPERISMPDFDVDFCQSGRGRVIDYVTQKYGEDRVGQIITFGKLQAKAVIRDVARVFALPYSEADMLSKLIPEELGITLEKALEMEPKLRELMETDPKIRQIISISRRLEGLLRHASIHAAGVIITNKPLVSYCPLFKGKEGEKVVQFDKDFSEKIGLVKFDFLGLKTLTVIDHAQKFIRRDKDADFDIEDIDLEDSSVYDFIGDGETIGVFQLESSGMIELCKRIKPNTLDDITAINALYRPGPLESGMVDDFIEIKHGRKEMTFPFEDLAPVLKDTYGVIVYQEQVMNVARIVGGYTLGQADMLRRAMGKKKVEEMDRHREIFRQGAIERGYDEKKAVDLFELMAKFAAYGFNKSHAVAYALIAYQTAFLKKYYPAAFFAGLLSTELSNMDKVTAYINDCRGRGIQVLPPDVNESMWLFNVVEENIRFGMGAVKNVGEGAVEALIREREENGPFIGFVDFCERVDLKAVGKRVIESLIKVGGFDGCEKELNRKTMLENMELIVAYAQKKQEEKALGQSNLFDLDAADSDDSNLQLDIAAVEDFDEREKLSWEAALMGIYVSGHPLDRFANVLKQMASMSVSEVHELAGGDKREMMLAGLISGRKNILTKKGDKMCFATLEDLTGKIECIVFPRTFAEYEEILGGDEPLIMEGQVNLAEEPRKFFPTKIQKLKDQAEERVTGVRISVEREQLNESRLKRFKQVLLSYRGSVPLHMIVVHDQDKVRMPFGQDFLVNPTPQLAAKINEVFQGNSVQFVVDGKLEDVGNTQI